MPYNWMWNSIGWMDIAETVAGGVINEGEVVMGDIHAVCRGNNPRAVNGRRTMAAAETAVEDGAGTQAVDGQLHDHGQQFQHPAEDP